jgi:hypothetical protein
MIKLIINFPFVMQNDWKTAYFARLYYPHFTTFRNETSEYLIQTCLDQNFTQKGKGLLIQYYIILQEEPEYP